MPASRSASVSANAGAAAPVQRLAEAGWSTFIHAMLHSAAMAIDAELLAILACPICKVEVKTVPLSEVRRTAVRDKFRDKFRGEEPVVEEGLHCSKCRRI